MEFTTCVVALFKPSSGTTTRRVYIRYMYFPPSTDNRSPNFYPCIIKLMKGVLIVVKIQGHDYSGSPSGSKFEEDTQDSITNWTKIANMYELRTTASQTG